MCAQKVASLSKSGHHVSMRVPPHVISVPPESKGRSSRSQEIRKWMLRLGVAAVVAIGFGQLLQHLQLPGKVATYMSLRMQLDKLTDENRKLHIENELLKPVADQAIMPAAIEWDARNHGMVRPSEQVYEIPVPPANRLPGNQP